jgi:hypothetical protein
VIPLEIAICDRGGTLAVCCLAESRPDRAGPELAELAALSLAVLAGAGIVLVGNDGRLAGAV